MLNFEANYLPSYKKSFLVTSASLIPLYTQATVCCTFILQIYNATIYKQDIKIDSYKIKNILSYEFCNLVYYSSLFNAYCRGIFNL